MVTGYLFIVPTGIVIFFVLLYFLIQAAAWFTLGGILFVRWLINRGKDLVWLARRAHRWLLTRA